MRRMPQQYANPHLRRERDPRAFRRQLCLLACCLLLAAGFVVAVRQQIVAVEYGYKTEALRREREELLDEQKRLLVELEQISSPAQLEAAAREMGLQPARAAQIETTATRAEPGAASFVGTATAGGVLPR
ncbi:MAG TPA: hypothetical protein VFS10_03115 [Pyrinomonadaceae bacterium]|nr:hypothetical protein [Pyrinomonadaceae bacterium]